MQEVVSKDLWNDTSSNHFGRDRSPARGWDINNDPITLKVEKISFKKNLTHNYLTKACCKNILFFIT